jgi:hypothetical protein
MRNPPVSHDHEAPRPSLPLAQECGEGQECIPDHTGFFFCGPDASGDAGAYSDSCEFINECDPGLVCLNPESTPVCDVMAGGCCTPVCDVTQPNTCPGAAEGQECQSWYEPGELPLPGLEEVGACSAVPLR